MTSRDNLLATTFVEMADTLVDDFDVVELLSHLGRRSVELFDAAAAGVLLTDPHGALRLMAATNEASEFIEVFQVQIAEGPCLDCFHTSEAIQVDDLESAADRWPRWVPVATGVGFRSAYAFPLRLRGRVLGALNLFRLEPSRLQPSSVAAAQALADVATIAILQHRAAIDAQLLAEQLQLALNSRIAIEQAKGVLAQSLDIDIDEAFIRLRRYSRNHQRQLSAVAQDVIDRRLAATEMGLTSRA